MRLKLNTIISLMMLTLCAALSPLTAQGHGRGGGMGSGVGGVHMGAGAGVGAGAGPASMGVGSRETARADIGTRADAMKRSELGVALSNNTRLASRTQAMLPAGQSVQQASAGFKNTGQFLAAVHVSHNLGIPFNQLKARMTGSQSVSLGKAIHELRGNVNAKAEEKKAKAQAKTDLEAEAKKQGG